MDLLIFRLRFDERTSLLLYVCMEPHGSNGHTYASSGIVGKDQIESYPAHKIALLGP